MMERIITHPAAKTRLSTNGNIKHLARAILRANTYTHITRKIISIGASAIQITTTIERSYAEMKTNYMPEALFHSKDFLTAVTTDSFSDKTGMIK